MALICRQHNLLFIMTPRTGCTAVGELLCSELGATYLPDADVLDESGKVVVQQKHSTLPQLIECGFLTPSEREKLCVFAAVRNPFDSLVSLYVKKSQTYQPLLDDADSWVHRISGYAEDMRFCKSHSFDEWIDYHYNMHWTDRWIRRQQRSLYRKYIEGVDTVLRFESLQADLDRVFKQCGVPGQHRIPLVNRTDERRQRYREYYSDRSKKIVATAFATDLKQFGYEF